MDVVKNRSRALLLLSSIIILSACGSRKSESSDLSKTGVDCSNQAVAKGEKIVRWKNGNLSLVKNSDNQIMMAAFMAQNKNEIDYIEDNFIIYSPKSQKLQTQGWGDTDTWGVDHTRAAELWNQNIKGAGVVVAVIDSGIDRTHHQLSAQLYTNPNETFNGVDDDGNGLIDDVHGYDFTSDSGDLEDTSGHGTHVAGIIAAAHDGGAIQGMAPDSKLLVYDFFTETGEGTVMSAIRAIQLSVEAGAKVINASWGGPSCSRTLNSTIDSLSSKNVLFVSAAGNEALDIDVSPAYPAAYQALNHITVAAITYDEYTAGFSNYGDRVQLAAPGVNILSTYPQDSQAYESGTSMAAPFVTGAVALLWSAYPNAKAIDIKRALMATVRQGPYPVETQGSLDVAAAYEYLKARR